MATNKFKNNFKALSKLFKTEEEFLDFLAKKKAFSEDFIKDITNSVNLKQENDIDIKSVKNYGIGYDKKNKQISIDITKNDVFSYYDSEEELIKKMKKYILNEDYERAQTLKLYFNTIELNYM